ncbi:hypothetical protein COB52_03365 [Candidatus Kaiserbacteria bacterium]|nr:MAG: hypothetical protein COB52_03365 [Candidatus Kaiserbacteria bacterium]
MDSTRPQNKEAVLFILLDAFRWDYLNAEDSPTLYKMASGGVYVKKLKSSSGFTQRSSLFTGAHPEIHGNYTMYVKDSENSPFKILRPFRKLLSKIPRTGLVHRVTRKFINQIPKVSSSWAPPGAIPSDVLSYISVIEDNKPIHSPGALPVESIFDVFQEENISSLYMMAPVSGDDGSTMKSLQKKMSTQHQAFFVQFSDTDGLVHISGVDSDKRRELVKEVDERVRALTEQFESLYPNGKTVVIGDHGMVDVEQYIDVWGEVESFAKENGLENTKDYLMFLDSTLARFWFLSEKGERILKPFLLKSFNDKGKWVDEEYMYSRNIPRNSEWYGDLMWSADEAVGIFPDYFHWPQDKYKAMHGYDSMVDSMKGMAIIHNASTREVIEEANLEDIGVTICDLLKIRHPDKATGKSLWKY